MKFERCPECGLMWDRHVRGGYCPHCKNLVQMSLAVGLGIMVFATSLFALIAWAL